jgi:hypothetical protein
LNLYAFAANNPIANIDPLGLQAKPAGDISDWDMQRRVEYVLMRAGGQIPGVIGDALRELVSPASLATTAVVFGIWAGSQLTPAGPFVDGAIVIAGYFIAGTGAVIAAKEIFKAALLTASAKCEADLQKAGDTLANGLVTALGAGAALAGTPQLSQALRTERVQGLINRVFKRAASGADSGASSLVNGARLNLQLTAEQAAGVRMPTKITEYSEHALQQIAGRDGGIGVSRSALLDAWTNPIKIEYVRKRLIRDVCTADQ